MGRILRRTRRRHHHPQGQLNRRWDTLSGTTSVPPKQQVHRSRRDRLEAETLASSPGVPGIDLDRLLALRDQLAKPPRFSVSAPHGVQSEDPRTVP